MSRHALPPALLAISAGNLTRAGLRDFLQRVGDAAEAGLGGLLLREKQLSDRHLLDIALALRAEQPGLWIGLHDRPHLLSAAGAQAVHLGWHSLAPSEVRPWLPASFAIGLSTHQGDDLQALGPVDYVFFGPVLPTPSKNTAQSMAPVGFDLLQAAASASRVPLWALGGLSPRDVRKALHAGAAGVACMSGILGQPDPGRAVEAYLREWAQAAHLPE